MNLCKGEETEGQTHAVCWGRRSDELAGPQWSDGNPTQSEDSGSDCGLMQTRDQTEKDTIKRAEDRQKNKVEMQEKEVQMIWKDKYQRKTGNSGNITDCGHSLDGLDFPMSASERWIGFLVWWRCFRKRTKLIFSRISGAIRPSCTCFSMMSSVKGRKTQTKD